MAIQPDVSADDGDITKAYEDRRHCPVHDAARQKAVTRVLVMPLMPRAWESPRKNDIHPKHTQLFAQVRQSQNAEINTETHL
jgi:hypothetical protein